MKYEVDYTASMSPTLMQIVSNYLKWNYEIKPCMTIYLHVKIKQLSSEAKIHSERVENNFPKTRVFLS